MQCNNPVWIEKNKILTPCLKCLGCRISITREWATRIIHECDSHTNSMFVTLTYDNDYLPTDNSLSIQEAQRFVKRLRKGNKIKGMKYFACGEYGEEEDRPHYHAIIFGAHYKNHPIDEFKIIISGPIKDAWPYGHVYAGNVNYQSARYVAKYIFKKHITNRKNPDYSQSLYRGRQEPFKIQSNGLGKEWALKNKEYLIKNYTLTINGEKTLLPRYYRNILNIDEVDYHNKMSKIKYEKEEKYKKKGYEIIECYGQYWDKLGDHIYSAKARKEAEISAEIKIKEDRK